MIENLNIQEVEFNEITLLKSSDESNSIFDMKSDDDFSNLRYCTSIIQKLLEISISDVLNFIYHHVQMVIQKLIWLDQFEKLIAANEKIFRKTKNVAKMMKIYTSIESKRIKLKFLSSVNLDTKPKAKFINAESEERYFSFHQTSKKLEQMEDYCEQILFLTQEKHEYEQAVLEFENKKLENFAIQCQKKIEHLQHMRKLKDELIQAELKAAHQKADFKKLQFNGNVNQLVDIFYQLSRELFVDGKSFLDGELNDIAKVIVASFVDKEGNDLSLKTVRTILTPSREDKRPNGDKRIEIEDFL